MGQVRAYQHQIGLNTPPEQNFTATAEAADGTMAIKRGVPGNYTGTPFSITALDMLLGSVSPAQFDSSFLLSTTEFVQRSLGNFSGTDGVTAATSLNASHCGKYINVTNSGYTITLPSTALVSDGSCITLRHLADPGGAVVTLAAFGAELIRFDNVTSSTTPLRAGEDIILVMRGGEWRVAGGSMALTSNGSSLFAKNLSVSGYQKLPSGLLVQWGQFAGSNAGDTPVTFPIPFPAALFTIYVSGKCTGTGAWGGFTGESLNGFSGNWWAAANTRQSGNAMWLAIGR